jgi:ribosomal protein S4
MSRYTGPVCRLCRRETATSKTGEKIKLFLKGDRCLSRKCAVERRGTAPGQNVVFRLNLASSRAQARQLVTHRHFRVNGRMVNIPSYIVKAGDTIEVGERSKKSPIFQSNFEVADNRHRPEWLDWSETEKVAKVLSLPSREQIDTPVDEQLIVEFYSR